MLLPILLCLAQATPPPYADEQDVIRLLEAIPEGSSALLPPVRVAAGDWKRYGMERLGPLQRDYCNRMPYAPERRTALYAGGNHQVPHRMNDVWEFHLGSNTWHMIYAPDGGNAGEHKGAYFLTSRTLVRDPGKELTDREKEQIEAYRKWWAGHVVFRDGHLTTARGGPIMPAHTWDAFCYDHRSRRLVWGMGASPAAQLSTHAYFTGTPLAELERAADAAFTPMWFFDPDRKRWIHYRTEGPRAALRGMGATMVYLPDAGTILWYVAAQNVSPHAFEMWRFDPAADRWTELRPNGGKSIAVLATKERVAPMSEQQSAYSPKHRLLVSVLRHETFVYDVEADLWSRAAPDERIFGHDAQSVFAYDSRAEEFLLAFPPQGKGKAMSLAAFSPLERRWRLIEPGGPGIPQTKYGMYMGYYDPRHNVFVVQGRTSDRVWVYRHRP